MKTQKSLLIDPTKIDSNYFKMVARVVNPLGASYAAAIIEEEGLEAKILHQLDSSNEELVKEINEFNPEVICLCSVMTKDRKHALNLADKIKEKNSDRIIIMGGDDPSVWPEVVSHKSIDYIGLGMGETVLPHFIDFLQGKIPIDKVGGLGYFKNGKVILNPSSEIESLDDIPFSKRDGLPWSKYKSFVIGENTLEDDEYYINMRASVGCNNRCPWCDTWRLFPNLLQRSIENVEEEIRQISQDYKIGFLDFMDANLVADKNWFLNLCQMLEKYNLHWRMFAHPQQVDSNVIKRASETGCRVIFYGLDIVDDKKLKAQKGLTLEDFSYVLKMTHEQGIHTIVSSIVGWPYETKETIEKTKDYLVKNPSERWYITFLNNFKEELESGTDPNLLDTTHPLHDTKGLTKEELIGARNDILNDAYNSKAWKELYLRNLDRYGEESERSYKIYVNFLRKYSGLGIDL